jgi:hypothetical protein
VYMLLRASNCGCETEKAIDAGKSAQLVNIMIANTSICCIANKSPEILLALSVRSRTPVLMTVWWISLGPTVSIACVRHFLFARNATLLKGPWHSGASRSLSNLGYPYLPPNLQVLCDHRFCFLDSSNFLLALYVSDRERKV